MYTYEYVVTQPDLTMLLCTNAREAMDKAVQTGGIALCAVHLNGEYATSYRLPYNPEADAVDCAGEPWED